MGITLVPCFLTSFEYPIFLEDCDMHQKELKRLVLCNRVEEALLAIFMVLQVSMVGFLVAHGRRDKTFQQAFYVFFVAVTIADCLLVMVVSRGLRMGPRQGPINSRPSIRTRNLGLEFSKSCNVS